MLIGFVFMLVVMVVVVVVVVVMLVFVFRKGRNIINQLYCCDISVSFEFISFSAHCSFSPPM